MTEERGGSDTSGARRSRTDAPTCPHQLASRALPEDVLVVDAIPADHTDALHPSEQAAVRRAVLSRRREFSTGRHCAREALRRLGVTARAIRTDPNRAPIWPTGVVGSLTHTRGYCAAAVSSSDHYRSIGLDVEADAVLNEALFDTICTPAELAALRGGSTPLGSTVAVVFSAKESVYKCQYVLSGDRLDFHDVAIEVDERAGTFQVRPLRDGLNLGDGTPLFGRFVRCCGLLATGLAVRRSSPGSPGP